MQKFAEYANLVYLMFGYIEKTNTSDKKNRKGKLYLMTSHISLQEQHQQQIRRLNSGLP